MNLLAGYLTGVSALTLVCAAPEAIEFPLVRDGRPAARVLVAGQDDDLAAGVADLKEYVRRITDAELEIRSGAEDLPGPTLHLGATDLFASTAAARAAIRGDGFLLAVRGEDCIVTGSSVRGTTHGIMTLLGDPDSTFLHVFA